MTSSQPLHVSFKSTSSTYWGSKWLESLPDLFAADFEVAPRADGSQKKMDQWRLDKFSPVLSREEKRLLKQSVNSTGLSHPSLTTVTHLSVAWSDHDAYVLVCEDPNMVDMLMRFLVNTDKTMLFHNFGYDGGIIYYYTHKLPKHVIDTQLLAKSILNNADHLKGETGLKTLMSYKYSKWGLSKDSFTLEEQNKDYMLEYSATDACATYALYQDILKDLEAWKI
jgi:hypothetical protein